jgi:hypothetical protein
VLIFWRILVSFCVALSAGSPFCICTSENALSMTSPFPGSALPVTSLFPGGKPPFLAATGGSQPAG